MSDAASDAASGHRPAGLRMPSLGETDLDRIQAGLRQVADAHERMRELLRAVLAISSELDLRLVLHRIVETSRDLVDARYAALGVLSKPATWGETFWDHLGLAIRLHQIDEVHIFEHQDCGAYRLLLGPADQARCKESPAQEKQVHHEMAQKLQQEIEKRYPDVIKKVVLRYIAIKPGSADGEVERF